MNTVFMNTKNSETSDPHRVLLNLTDKLNLRNSNKYVFLSKPEHLLSMEKYKKVI